MGAVCSVRASNRRESPRLRNKPARPSNKKRWGHSFSLLRQTEVVAKGEVLEAVFHFSDVKSAIFAACILELAALQSTADQFRRDEGSRRLNMLAFLSMDCLDCPGL